MDNDLKFFTNEPERDLYSRFCNILKGHTQFFDILVGYFRTSGFFRMYPAMKDVEKIRILVGLNVDAKTVQLMEQAQAEGSVTIKEATEQFAGTVETEFAAADPSFDVERGVHAFIDWLKTGKLELRMYTEAPIHAKVYVLRKDPAHVPDQFGSVITGSSNFSLAGLQNHLEFNVELKDSSDVKFALGKFEELWAKSVDVTQAYVATVEHRTWLRDDITPYEIYLKTIYEFFREEINADKEALSETLLPDGYMRLQYQIDAVLQAKKTLEAYGGVFIADVVGLGKTYICAMLAKLLPKGRKLVVCPPVLVDYWQGVLQEFDVAAEVASLGKLDSIMDKADKYRYVFVDEAHRFRNAGTEAFSKLHAICFRKQVVLISATPINNYTSDIENQIYLFQPKHNSNIVGLKNLEAFFTTLKKRERAAKKLGPEEHMAQIRANSEIIRDRLLRHIMIRRTRSEVAQYYARDMEAQGLTFPKLGAPRKIIYEFDELTDRVFTETIHAIQSFSYARYKPLTYLKPSAAAPYAQMMTAQQNLGGFMKGILVKRLESSFFAFRKTLQRFIESYQNFLAMLDNGDVYISKKVNVYDLMDNGDDEKLLHYIETEDVMHFKASAFRTDFIVALENDLEQLSKLQKLWSHIKRDPKLETFVHQLQIDEDMAHAKKIVFTESRETAEYLAGELAVLYGGRIACFSGDSHAAQKKAIEYSFNPKYADKNDDRYDLLITTDVLAEGVNLHRANVIVNYDLPWNPTRIMQRVGRINRVGTAHAEIFVYNFFPTAQASAQLPLTDRILEKLQAFHDTMGDDYKFLSDEEDPSPHKLFRDISQDLSEEETSNPELAYLAEIRAIRDGDPQLFQTIKRLPRKSKTGRASETVEEESVLTFVRKGALKSFFLAGKREARGLTFLEAMNLLACGPDESRQPVGAAYYELYKANDAAFDASLEAEDVIAPQHAALRGNDKTIQRVLKAALACGQLTDEEEALAARILAAIENGDIPQRVTKDIVKSLKAAKDPVAAFAVIRGGIDETYLHARDEAVLPQGGTKEVILSCFLQPS